MREFIFKEQETTIPVKGKRLVICAELVRCKDCKWYAEPIPCATIGDCRGKKHFSVLMGEGRTAMLNDMCVLCQRFTGGRSHYNNHDRRNAVSVLRVSLHFIWRDL